jgi:hypothetical protein
MVLEKMRIIRIIKTPISIHVLAFIFLLAVFLVLNHSILSKTFWESGDYALSVIDVIAAKKFEAYTFLTSSQMVFRHPGPILTYWYALLDYIILGLNKNVSPVISQAIASAVLNLIFQISTIYIIYKNLLNKILIIPIAISMLLFLNAIVEYQLTSATPIMISISAFMLMIFSCVDIISNKNLKNIIFFIFAYIFCIQMHGNFIICSTALFLVILINYLKYINKYENKINLYVSLVILFISLIPILYDQIFVSHNISAILKFLKANKDINLLERTNNYLNEVIRFIPTFFIDFIYSKKYKLEALEKGKYLIDLIYSTTFYSIYIVSGIFILKNKNSNFNFLKKLYLIISIGMIIGIYISLGKLGDSRVYNAQYPVRYMYAFGYAYLTLLIMFCDRIFYKSKTIYMLSIALIISLILIIKDSKSFFNKNAGINAGYFVIPTYVGTDYRFGDMVESIKKNTRGESYQIMVETDNWPVLAGITSILLRNGHKVSMNNKTYAYFFKIPNQIIENENSIKIYITGKEYKDKVLLYRDNNLFIYKNQKKDLLKISFDSNNDDTTNLLSGWENIENGYIWAMGPSASFFFEYGAERVNNLVLELRCKTPYGLKRNVQIYLNQNYLTSKFVQGNYENNLRISLPKEYINLDQKNQVLLKFPDAIELNKIGFGDSRPLALAVYYLEVK